MPPKDAFSRQKLSSAAVNSAVLLTLKEEQMIWPRSTKLTGQVKSTHPLHKLLSKVIKRPPRRATNFFLNLREVSLSHFTWLASHPHSKLHPVNIGCSTN